MNPPKPLVLRHARQPHSPEEGQKQRLSVLAVDSIHMCRCSPSTYVHKYPKTRSDRRKHVFIQAQKIVATTTTNNIANKVLALGGSARETVPEPRAEPRPSKKQNQKWAYRKLVHCTEPTVENVQNENAGNHPFQSFGRQRPIRVVLPLTCPGSPSSIGTLEVTLATSPLASPPTLLPQPPPPPPPPR